MQFFRDADNLKAAMSCASPFRYSSDWASLKESALPHPPIQNQTAPPVSMAPTNPPTRQEVTRSAPSAVPESPAPVAEIPKEAPAPIVQAMPSKPAVQEAVTKVPEAQPQSTPMEPSSDNTAIARPKPDSIVLKRQKVNNFCILATYLQDQEYFEEQIKAKSLESNYHFSKESLRDAIHQLCAEPTEEEILDFQSYLKFPNNVTPAYDVIELLRAFRDVIEVAPQSKPHDDAAPTEFVSDQEQYRINRIMFYKAFAESCDRITGMLRYCLLIFYRILIAVSYQRFIMQIQHLLKNESKLLLQTRSLSSTKS